VPRALVLSAVLALALFAEEAHPSVALTPPAGKYYLDVNPLVVRADGNESVALRLYTNGSVTSAELELAAGPTVSLAPAGGGAFSITLTHAQALFGYTATDYLHNFVGFLNIYSGSTRLARLNIFVNVDDGTIPAVSIKSLGSNARSSPHLLAVHMPAADPATLSLFDAAKAFYQFFPDQFDFLGVVSAPQFFENRFYVAVRNNTSGIGPSLFDQTAFYGSAGRLQGVVRFPVPNLFDLANRAALHEIAHRWGVFLPGAPFGAAQPHWPVSTLARGILGFNIPGSNVGGDFSFDIVPLGDGTYRLVAVPQLPTYSDMELYLMGLLPAGDVGSHTVFLDQNQEICHNCVLHGPTLTYNAQSVVSALGPRMPAYPNSQRDFRFGTIFITTERPLTDREIAYFDYMAARGEATEPLTFSSGFSTGTTWPFALATGGRGTLKTRIEALPFRSVAPGVARTQP
jgi:hypothetical protein